MNLNESFPVSESKKASLLAKIQYLGIDPSKIEEAFQKGGGKGGQKINKTNNAVRLAYPPLDLSVKVQRERSRSLNRFLALRELVDQIEMKIRPEKSARLKAREKKKKQKSRRRRRSRSAGRG